MSAPKYCIELRSPEFGPVTLNTHHIGGVWTDKHGATRVATTFGQSMEVAETRAEVTALMGGARKAGDE